MAKIKGRYVAQIELNFEFDESEKGLLPFERIRERVVNELTPYLKEIITNEICSPNEGTVNVTQMYADVWKAEENV